MLVYVALVGCAAGFLSVPEIKARLAQGQDVRHSGYGCARMAVRGTWSPCLGWQSPVPCSSAALPPC